MNNDDPEREVHLYTYKVMFFSFFSNALKKEKIKHEIELTVPAVYQGKTNDVNPDFLILDNNKVITVFEHKSSIPENEEQTMEIVNECCEKYSNIIYNGGSCNPQIFLLLPETGKSIIKKIKNKIKNGVGIWVFNLNKDEMILTIENELGEINESKLKKLLNSPINVEITDFSKTKFIREEPHPVYTTVLLWGVILKTRLNPMIGDSYKMTIEDVIKEANSLYPRWIGDTSQITGGRINKAIDFLHRLGFVKKIGNNEIEVFHRRGARTGDMIKYFSKKWKEIPYVKKDSAQKNMGEYI